MAEMIDGAGNIPDIREMVNSAVSGEDGARMNWMMNLLPWTQTFSLGFLAILSFYLTYVVISAND